VVWVVVLQVVHIQHQLMLLQQQPQTLAVAEEAVVLVVEMEVLAVLV